MPNKFRELNTSKSLINSESQKADHGNLELYGTCICSTYIHIYVHTCIHTIQLDLNLMLTRTVPACKIHVSCAHSNEHAFFGNLHASKNPSRVTYECTVHGRASLVTRYTPTSMSNTQVKRVHTGKNSYTQVREPISTGALWYLRGINHRIMGLSTRYNLTCVLLADLCCNLFEYLLMHAHGGTSGTHMLTQNVSTSMFQARGFVYTCRAKCN